MNIANHVQINTLYSRLKYSDSNIVLTNVQAFTKFTKLADKIKKLFINDI